MIFKGLTAYSFRIDLSNNQQSTAEIVKFFEKYDVEKYYGNPELGEETQKAHYQMIIWMQEKQQKEIVKMRNYWRGKVPTKKGGGVSLKKARDENKLFGYCRKEEKNSILTNVSKEIYLKIKKYKTLIALKEQKREKLEKIIGGISQKQQKEIVKMRNYWRGKVPTKKGGGVSLKKARDENKLFGYCRKEEKNSILTNVSKEIYLKIKKYKTLIALKEQKREKLEKIIGGISQKLTKYEFAQALSQAYFRVYNTPCDRQRYYNKWLYIRGYYDDRDILDIARVNLRVGVEHPTAQKVEYLQDNYGTSYKQDIEEQQQYI